MTAIPGIGDHPDRRRGRLGSFPDLYVRRIEPGDIACERQYDRPWLLGHADLPTPEGLVLGREAHREFLEQSGLLEEFGSRGGRDGELALQMRVAHRSDHIGGELNRELCDALIGLGAPSVTVSSEGFTRRGLKSIPEVKAAVRDAWLSLEGLGRQVEAAARGEQFPTWSVSILAEQGGSW